VGRVHDPHGRRARRRLHRLHIRHGATLRPPISAQIQLPRAENMHVTAPSQSRTQNREPTQVVQTPRRRCLQGRPLSYARARPARPAYAEQPALRTSRAGAVIPPSAAQIGYRSSRDSRAVTVCNEAPVWQDRCPAGQSRLLPPGPRWRPAALRRHRRLAVSKPPARARLRLVTRFLPAPLIAGGLRLGPASAAHRIRWRLGPAGYQ
jgi:hypothetical protein